MTRCANPECSLPAGQRFTQPCLLNTGGMPDVIGSPCASFVPANPECGHCGRPQDTHGEGGKGYCQPARYTLHGIPTRFVAAEPREHPEPNWRDNEPAQPKLPGARCETCGGLFTPDGICRTCNPQPRCVDLGVTEAQPPVECNAVEMDDDGVVVRDSHGDTNSMRRVKLAQPPVECEHPVARSWDINDGKDFPFRADNVQCDDCVTPMVVRPASQWAAVEALVAEWESNVPEGNDTGVLGGMYAGCARQLRKALGLERVTKGEG